MKSSNILMMAMLMVVGAGSNLWAIATITNVGNEIVGVQFYDKNKKPLDLVMANNPGEKIPGQLWYGGTTMNISTKAAFVTIGYTQGIPNTNTYKVIKELISLFPIKSSTSYTIVGYDLSANGPTIMPWAIVDSNSYKETTLEDYMNSDAYNAMFTSPEVNSYLQKLQDTAVKNDINTFSTMYNQLLSALNNIPYKNNSLSTNDMNKTMQDIAKIQPMNINTFSAYIKLSNPLSMNELIFW